MPNTTAHLGIQTIAGRVLFRPKTSSDSDILWLWLGCVLPDLPWILQRIARHIIDGDARYDLRLYAVSLGTLLGCLVLAAAVSVIAEKPARVFLLLSSTALFHLLLDGTQIKWGNGPILLAPYDWRDLPGITWAESHWTLILVALGAATVITLFKKATASRPELELDPPRLLPALALLTLWLLLPIALMPSAERHGVHGVGALRDPSSRAGRDIQFYYTHWQVPAGGSEPRLLTMTSEPLVARGLEIEAPARVSARARFIDGSTVEILEYHVHRSTRRDVFSYIGLAVVALAWLRAMTRQR